MTTPPNLPTGSSRRPAKVRTTPLPVAAAEPGAARRVTLAAIVGAHGITGEVRLKLFTEDLARYPVLDAAGATLTLRSVRGGANGAVARFAEVRDRTAAEALRGTALTVSRDDLPPLGEGEYYHADVIGLPCVSGAGEPLGRVAAIEDFGAGDVLEVERADGSRAMIAFRAPYAILEPTRVVIDPPFLV